MNTPSNTAIAVGLAKDVILLSTGWFHLIIVARWIQTPVNGTERSTWHQRDLGIKKQQAGLLSFLPLHLKNNIQCSKATWKFLSHLQTLLDILIGTDVNPILTIFLLLFRLRPLFSLLFILGRALHLHLNNKRQSYGHFKVGTKFERADLSSVEQKLVNTMVFTLNKADRNVRIVIFCRCFLAAFLQKGRYLGIVVDPRAIASFIIASHWYISLIKT